ncbi:unnamed protein product [Absidia cylindrospora]
MKPPGGSVVVWLPAWLLPKLQKPFWEVVGVFATDLDVENTTEIPIVSSLATWTRSMGLFGIFKAPCSISLLATTRGNFEPTGKAIIE